MRNIRARNDLKNVWSQNIGDGIRGKDQEVGKLRKGRG